MTCWSFKEWYIGGWFEIDIDRAYVCWLREYVGTGTFISVYVYLLLLFDVIEEDELESLEGVLFSKEERYGELCWRFDITGLKRCSFCLSISISCCIPGMVAKW